MKVFSLGFLVVAISIALPGESLACKSNNAPTAGSREIGKAMDISVDIADESSPFEIRRLRSREMDAYLKAGKLVMAEMAGDPHNPVHYARLAVVNNALGRHQQALQVIQKGLQACPDSEELLRLRQEMRPRKPH